MKLVELSIAGAYLLESPVMGDDRGFFREWYKLSDVHDAGVDFSIQQSNVAMSKRNVVRGLHYSLAPEGQAKLVTCAHGEFDDVLADIRVDSPTFGVVEVIHLAAGEGHSVFVPGGLAHGYCVTSELGVITYLLSSPYSPAVELEINPFDETLNVPWNLSGEAVLSDKDAAAPSLIERREARQLPHFPTTLH